MDKLGNQIRTSDVVSDADRAALREILSAHVRPMEDVQDDLKSLLGVPVQARPKTEKSTIEKLKRNPRLSTIQDLAGARIIINESDPAMAAVTARCARARLGGHIQDRRRRPSQGYRAIHLIVQRDGC